MALVLERLAWHHDGMGEIVNLRRVRKRKQRDEAAAVAAANRAKSGRTKAERNAAEQERAATSRTLDGARIEKPAED